MLCKRAIKTFGKRNELLRKIGYTNYQDYLKSEHWNDVKNRAKKSKLLGGKNKKCSVCNKNFGLTLHHKTYKTLGKERLNHLCWLCFYHHELVSKKFAKNGIGNWSGYKILKNKLKK